MLISNKLYSSRLEMCSFDYIILGTNLAFVRLEFQQQIAYFHQASKTASKLYMGIRTDIKSSQFVHLEL